MLSVLFLNCIYFQKNSVSRSDLSPTNSAVEDTMSLGSVPQISSMENTTSGNDECQIKYETLDKNDFTDVSENEFPNIM